MFRSKPRETTLGLKEVMIATTKIMENSKWQDESLEGLLLQVSLLRQIIESFQKTEKSLTKMLGSRVSSNIQN